MHSTIHRQYTIWLATLIARRPQWPRGLRRVSATTRLLGVWVRIPPGTWMFFCYKCCVLPGRGLCVGPITRPEECYRLCMCVCVCVCVCGGGWYVQWEWSRSPVRGGHDPESGRSATEKTNRYLYIYMCVCVCVYVCRYVCMCIYIYVYEVCSLTGVVKNRIWEPTSPLYNISISCGRTVTGAWRWPLASIYYRGQE